MVDIQIEIIKITCIECGVFFCVSKSHKEKLIQTKKTFYCPNGHTQSFN